MGESSPRRRGADIADVRVLHRNFSWAALVRVQCGGAVLRKIRCQVVASDIHRQFPDVFGLGVFVFVAL